MRRGFLNEAGRRAPKKRPVDARSTRELEGEATRERQQALSARAAKACPVEWCEIIYRVLNIPARREEAFLTWREALCARTVAKDIEFYEKWGVGEYYWIQFLLEQYESPLGREFAEQAVRIDPACAPGSAHYLLAFADFYFVHRAARHR